jgi:putative endonuclease
LSTFSKGRLGEELACSYLKGCAVKILKRNLRSPFGEVDIIGVEGRVLVFFEVKYFQNGSIADLENVIDPKETKPNSTNSSVVFRRVPFGLRRDPF